MAERLNSVPKKEEMKNSSRRGIAEKAQRKAFELAVDHAVKKIRRADDKTQALLDIIDQAAGFIGGNSDTAAVDNVKKAIASQNTRWNEFIRRIIEETDAHYLKRAIMTLGFDAFYKGTKTIRENREKYHCNIPWLILFDPTMACNMHCIGCWSGTYGHKAYLTNEEMDRIVTQGKEIGVYLYMLTGGEPTVRMKDIMDLAEKHSDCFFGLYTNSTLLTDEICERVQKLGNITFILSIEGTPETNDGRRGEGHYDAVMRGMDLLQKYGIIFGTSICYTRDNTEAVTSDEFFRLLESKGARFGFYFHFMPVGNNAAPELMPTVEQRKYIIKRIREVRGKDSDMCFFPMDFQNDGEFVGGCIAGGRNYFHINSNGDAEPCVFIHFSDSNIKEKSVIECLQSPLFKMYHEGQPFNRNHLRPCPMLENPQLLRSIIKTTGAHQTNLESPEDVDHLCAKCDAYAQQWAPAAEEIWASQEHKPRRYVNYSEEKTKNPELAAFEHI